MSTTTSAAGTKPPAAKRPQPSARRGSTQGASGTPERGSGGGGTPTMTRRPSVQFKVDETQTKTSHTAAQSGRGGDVEFKRNMNDFLNVMYGGKSAGDKSSNKSAHLQVPSGTDKGTHTTSGTTTGSTAAANRASQYRAAATADPKGPLVKGVLANQATIGGDNIDSLVTHLVRAYSRSTTPSNGFHDDAETPINYGGQYGRARRHAGSQIEVEAFVSQAMDSFFVPQSGSGPLSSKRSMLSSLGTDQNFEKLLSFHPNSNVPEEEDEDTPVVPTYIGGMAMFNPADHRGNDVSVSKSMPMVMHGGADGGAGGPRGLTPAARTTAAANPRRANMDMSLNSAIEPSGAGRSREGPVAGRRAVGRPGGLNREMSLDSKAICGALTNADDDDDSWAEVDAAAVAEALKNVSSDASKTPLVSNRRSSMTAPRAKTHPDLTKKVKALVDEETLSRNVLLAVEHQLRAYIDTAHTDESKKLPQRRT